MRKFGILYILFLVACSSNSTPKPIEKKSQEKITVWHWMNDRQATFEQLAKQYEKQTGISVEFKLFFPPEIYNQKVIAAARAGNLPEIFGVIGEKKTLGSLINAGYIFELTPAMQANGKQWQKQFYPKALEVVTFTDSNSYQVKPGIYGVPIDITVMQLLYNKNLLTQAGLNPPKNFDEFIYAAKIIKEKTNADGFICGWGETWLLNSLAIQWAINIMGEEKFYQTLDGKVNYTDSDWLKTFELFAKLKDSGILANSITTLNNKESETAFSKNQAAFSYDGTWVINVYKQLNKNLPYVFMPLPPVIQTNPIKIWGGGGSSFMISAKSPQKQLALNFLKWLTAQPQQKTLIQQTDNLPAVINCTEAMPEILKPLVVDFDNLTHPNIWPKNENSQVLEKLNLGLQQIVLGIKTPQEVAELVQKTKERTENQ